ncbi:hypothetical protein Zmor_024534 [Zophobas morio]|uniref:Multiple inositol polyphosphate phosphatase 1 n=1 Tax=Zophobas morio TaxID=2755281 RepID=A0AA38I563_9CUCU|nr:hypothetical protein Zmor_024534 [Zophobas morio]
MSPNRPFVPFFVFFLCVCTSFQCPKNEYESHLGTKTAYRTVANYNSSEIKYDGCQAVKLWALIRHGTRNPSLALIQKMRTRLAEIKELILENLPEGTDEISNIDLDLFRSWTPKLRDKDEKKLTHEGEEEMLFLAERLQNRFPKLMTNIYSSTLYKFKYTHSQRTKKSAEAFAAGLFGRGAVRDIEFPEPVKKDPVLRFYKLCEKWTKEVKKNPEAQAEMKKFHSGEEAAKTVKAVNERLGLTDEIDLSDVHAMYMTCAYETAWNKRKRSPWCSALSMDDFKVVEYGEDLKYYWIDGYGHELTYGQACKALNDLVEFFQSNETFPKSTIYFTHSGTLLKMLAHMGLYKQKKHLIADDFHLNGNRTWRVSQIDSFGTNLVFVLFDCQDEPKILTLHQEHIVRLPSCADSDLCTMTQFMDYYDTDSECLFDQMCENST